MAGETTATTALHPPLDVPFGALVVPLSAAYSTSQNELNDVMEMGWLPPGTYYGVVYSPTDMDTNVSPALVQKVTVGSTDVATALTGGQTGSKTFVGITPITITVKTKVTVTSTTAAATAAAGTLYLTFLGAKV